MILLKNHKYGFTLIETMLALVIISTTLTPMFILFGSLSEKMHRSSQDLQAMLAAKQLLHEARIKQDPAISEFSLEKKIEESDITVQYQLEKAVSQKSSLAFCDSLHREVITVTWIRQDKKYSDQFISYVYKAEQKKS